MFDIVNKVIIMSKYYILLPDDTEADTDYSTNVLGESSFKSFWAESGFDILNIIVNKYPDIIEHIIIKDEKNKKYEVMEFIEKISKLEIIKN